MSYQYNGKVYELHVQSADDRMRRDSRYSTCRGCAFSGSAAACENAPPCSDNDVYGITHIFKEVGQSV